GEDEVLLARVLHVGAGVLAVDDDVTHGHDHGDAVALVVDAAGAEGDVGALLGLLLGGGRDDEARRRGLLGLEGLHDDAVLEGLDGDRHCGPPLRMSGYGTRSGRTATVRAAVAGVGLGLPVLAPRPGPRQPKSMPGFSTRSRR